jgi:hypothetical protein
MSVDAHAGRPSVIAPRADTKGYEGAGIIEAAMGVKDGVENGDWFSVGGNTVAMGLTLLGAVMDPLQAILSAGVGWCIEHCKFLREPLDKLAGDPKAIEGHAKTWQNIERRIYEAEQYFIEQVNQSTRSWTSDAATAYRQLAKKHSDAIEALGIIADTLNKGTIQIGALVGAIRNTIRDIVAEVVGAIISKALQALTVVLIPKVAAEITILVSKTATKIFTLLKGLFRALAKFKGLTKLAGNVVVRINEHSHNVLILEAYRLEAVDAAHGIKSFVPTFKTVASGHNAVHGTGWALAGDITQGAARSNTFQNAGQAADQSTDSDDPTPPKIEIDL